MKYFTTGADTTDVSCLPNYKVEMLLRKIKKTSAACDNLSAWVFRNCSFELASIVTHILNCSFSTSAIPSSWLTAIATPVPKLPKAIVFTDYTGLFL